MTGARFATRRVVARQHGRPIYFLTANFQLPEEGFEHQDAMPEVAGPEAGIPFADLVRTSGADERNEFAKEWAALDVRYLGNSARQPHRRPLPARPRPAVDPRRRPAP